MVIGTWVTILENVHICTWGLTHLGIVWALDEVFQQKEPALYNLNDIKPEYCQILFSFIALLFLAL